MTDKPYKGEMKHWWKEHFDAAEASAHYKESVGLGFTIRGTFLNHPDWGYSEGSHTSWIVVMEEPDAEGNRMIETRNSRYKLIGEPVDWSREGRAKARAQWEVANPEFMAASEQALAEQRKKDEEAVEFLLSAII